jgi:hypothetical protein
MGSADAVNADSFSFYFYNFCTAFGLFLNWLMKLDIKFSAFTKNIRLAGSSVISLLLKSFNKN